ncbi:MAG: multiheme c-type cytochrome [Syntrophales bacterium]
MNIRWAGLVVLFGLLPFSVASAQDCAECHKKVTPQVVVDWQLSKHSKAKPDPVVCCECHGHGHLSADDAHKAYIPGPEVCGHCHEKQVKQFSAGKHSLAWQAMKAMPTIHYQPMLLIDGMKGCGGCHKIGRKSKADIQELKKAGNRGYGLASCDACHTRHAFSVTEARQPQACQTCHMGFDHPQWEMYSGSKHGVRSQLKQMRLLPETAAAPTCQTCHMQDGNHGVRAAWGFLGVRLPLPDDGKWAADRTAILKALGVLDPAGNPTPRLAAVKAADMARLTQEEWQKDRDTMLKACIQCHSRNFATAELRKGDSMIREADALMAEAIAIVADLYKEGILRRPASYAHVYPDLLAFHDAPTVIEQKLFVMFLEHRMRAFQGVFHGNPDYALWYGWSEMRRDLTEIKERAAELRLQEKEAKQAGGTK